MAPGRDREPLLAGGLPTQYVDVDPDETGEWLDSFDALVAHAGPYRARYIMLSLLRRAAEQNVGVPSLRSTDYINTIPPEREPWFPGDEAVERRIRAYARWNAAIMVHRAQRPGVGVGGHISTYASTASLYEVGFNHFFRGKDHPGGGDQIYFQGHGSPGMYARAFLEGRLDRAPDGRLPPGALAPRRRPVVLPAPAAHAGLLGVPDRVDGPRPDQRDLPGALQQVPARPRHQGHQRAARVGVPRRRRDGRGREPRRAADRGAREELDNLTFVVNCNLQRLDGPVRGNGKIIQELESFFRGAGWNVIKVVWGRNWDDLLAQDSDGALVNLMNRTPDGDYQTYKAEDGAFVREHFFGRDPRTRKMVENWTDEEIWSLSRGGHDYRKMYAAYRAATEHKGQPTVILAKTIKGWTLGSHFEGRNATHQMKKLTLDDLKAVPRPAADPDRRRPSSTRTCRPTTTRAWTTSTSQYMLERRRALGGGVPDAALRRPSRCVLPGDAVYDVVKRGSGKQQIATTMAFVRLLKDLMRDPEIGPRIVPIIPDEARTFGMDSMFPTAKIYSPHGQTYTSVDRDLVLAYKESTSGQILHEGINEAGSVASFTAAGLVVRDARRADDPDLHLLLDVRLPAHGRRLLGRDGPDGARLRARRHRRSHDAQRRGPAARGRPLARARRAPTRPSSPTTRRTATSSGTSSRTACAGCTARSPRTSSTT